MLVEVIKKHSHDKVTGTVNEMTSII